jgi:hypothetical protein
MAASYVECHHSPQWRSAPVAWASCTPGQRNSQTQERNLHDMQATGIGPATTNTGYNGRYQFSCSDCKQDRVRLSDVVSGCRYVVGGLKKYCGYRKTIANGKMVCSRWYHILLGAGDAVCQLPATGLNLKHKNFPPTQTGDALGDGCTWCVFFIEIATTPLRRKS